MRITGVQTVAALAFAGLFVSADSATADQFTDQHARGFAANKYGAFSIRLKDGQTVFHSGERIQLELVYEQPGHELYINRAYGSDSRKCIRVHFDRPVAEHVRIDGSKFTDGLSGGILGGVTSTPDVTEVTLTDDYRFDAAGHYRVFVESRQITPDFETSNILEFEILPRDPAWKAHVLDRARRTLSESSSDRVAVAQAFAELRALGTNDATATLARFYETGDADRPGRNDIWNGLVSSPDRAFAERALLPELTNPERTIGRHFIHGLALLQVFSPGRTGPQPSHDEYMGTVRQLALTRANALNRIPRLLETEIRRELSTSSSEQYFVGGGVTAAAQVFPKETTAAFLGLTAEAQHSRLIGTWRTFADPIFLPLLRSVYESPAEGSDATRDIALRRLYELAPEEGRSTMLAELRRDRPRVSIETLGALPDGAFPQMTAHWVELLGDAVTAEDRASAAQRLARFGTAQVAASVEGIYHRMDDSLECMTRAALLAYIVRVDVRRGERLLTSAATGDRWDDTCPSSLIEAVADMEWSLAVERAAIVALRDADLDFAGRVARVLADRGSVAARRPLETRLRQVQSKIAAAGRRADPSAEDQVWRMEVSEQELARAVSGAKSWTLTAAERKRFAARCSDAAGTSNGCGNAFGFDDSMDPPLSVRVFPAIGDERQLHYYIGSHRGRSLDDLDHKLRQFPSGTRIHWNDWPQDGYDSLHRWTWSERDALFERVRRQAATYGVILQRDRKYIGPRSALCPE